jgi:hypothetical protein
MSPAEIFIVILVSIGQKGVIDFIDNTVSIVKLIISLCSSQKPVKNQININNYYINSPITKHENKPTKKIQKKRKRLQSSI